MRYKIALLKTDEGYSVSVPGLPGCWSQGITEEEAKKDKVLDRAWRIDSGALVAMR